MAGVPPQCRQQPPQPATPHRHSLNNGHVAANSCIKTGSIPPWARAGGARRRPTRPCRQGADLGGPPPSCRTRPAGLAKCDQPTRTRKSDTRQPERKSRKDPGPLQRRAPARPERHFPFGTLLGADGPHHPNSKTVPGRVQNAYIGIHVDDPLAPPCHLSKSALHRVPNSNESPLGHHGRGFEPSRTRQIRRWEAEARVVAHKPLPTAALNPPSGTTVPSQGRGQTTVGGPLTALLRP